MTQPGRPHIYEPISVVEDLDPEVEGERVGGLRFDLLVGIPLILAVILFAGWQWWHQDYQSSQYNAGLEAAGRNDLAAAVHYYSEASGYSNADALLKSAREQLAERDRLYQSAVTFAEEREWLSALRDVRALAKIQPGYKDIVSLEDKAISHIYTDALSGTVLLREKATPPGLYYRSTQRWVWLEWSDAASTLFGTTSEGYMLFDAAEQTKPGASSSEGVYDYASSRRFVVAHSTGGELEYRTMPLDASLFVPTVVGKNGFWALNYGSSMLDGTSDQSRYMNPVVDEPFHESNMAYQAYSGADTAYVALRVTEDVSTGSVIVAVNPDDNHYLIAEWTGAGTSGPTQDTVVNLYLRAAGEALNQPVYSYTGGSIRSAILSPDNSFVVVTAHKEVDEGNEWYEKITTSLIDLKGKGGPYVLSELLDNRDPYRPPHGSLRANFVHAGGFEGELLLAEYTQEHTNILLIDPDKVAAGDHDYVVKQIELLGDIDGNWRIREQNEAGIAVTSESYSNAAEGVKGGTYTLHAIVFPVDGPLETYRIRSGSTHEISVMRTTGKYIRWSDSEYADPAANPTALITRSIFNVDRRGSPSSDTRVKFSADTVISQAGQKMGSINLGDDLMVYIVNGELHARAYNGDIDILLEKGVTALFENQVYDASWLR